MQTVLRKAKKNYHFIPIDTKNHHFLNIFPKGYGIFYSNHSAHRDPNVFDNPDDFIPERWENANKNDTDKIFGFGAGSHRCIGENLMMHVLKYVAKNVIQNFTWTHLDNPMDRNIKCLPVLRPRELTPVILSRK